MEIEFVKETCKLGQGADCCRYLMMGIGFECAKLTSLKITIDSRVAKGTFNAKGDNCDGIKK